MTEIEIASAELIYGWLPPRALRLVEERAAMHKAELQANCDRARAHDALLPIDPLP